MDSLKITFTLLILIVSGTFIAQEEVSKKDNFLTVESQYLLRKDSNYVPNVKFRYFLGDKGAVRLKMSYAYNSSKKEIFEISGDGVGTLERINDLLRVSLGYEKHFPHDKFTSYVGGELIMASGKKDVYGSRTDSSSYIPDYNFSTKIPVNQVGGQLFTGIDVNVYEGLYIGTEIGLNYLVSQQKRGEYKGEDGSSTTAATVTEKIPAVINKKFYLGSIGLIRIGWKF